MWISSLVCIEMRGLNLLRFVNEPCDTQRHDRSSNQALQVPNNDRPRAAKMVVSLEIAEARDVIVPGAPHPNMK